MKPDKNKKTVEAYDKNALFYAKTFNDYGTRREDVDRALRLNKSNSSNLLELGCANGRDAKYIVSKIGAENYTGIDASAELINLARKDVTHVTFQVKDMREIDFNPETFGLVLSFYTVLHMKREDLVILLQKAHKWLKTGGILYISSKYGEYKEIPIENLGDTKYYYSYTPDDLVEVLGIRFEVVYKAIHDSEYGPSFTIALRKI